MLLGVLKSTSQSEVTPEATLPQRLIHKDVKAFEQLYDLHFRTVYSLVRRIVQQSSTAEEVVQDVFLHLWRNAAQYDPERGPFIPWLLTLARNRALDHLRLKSERQRRREDVTEVMPQLVIAPGYEEVLDKKRWAERVQTSMGSLHPRQKEAIELTSRSIGIWRLA